MERDSCLYISSIENNETKVFPFTRLAIDIYAIPRAYVILEETYKVYQKSYLVFESLRTTI